MESFFGPLKRERTHQASYATRDQAKTDVFDYIEAFYRRWAIGAQASSSPRVYSLNPVSTERGEPHPSETGATGFSGFFRFISPCRAGLIVIMVHWTLTAPKTPQSSLTTDINGSDSS